jgi:tetratricopeptide (TPR) repeat protein
MADDISAAILDQNDPETVRDGAPAYLLMIDGLIAGDPRSGDLLLAGARLYGSYSAAFTDDPARAARLAGKSLEYARRAVCLDVEAVCEASGERLDRFGASLEETGRQDVAPLYAYAVAWAGWIQVNSGDWNAVADLPKVTALFERCLVLDESYDYGGAHLYLGVIKTLRPAALGGEPEAARVHFERAIEISTGRNLMMKVLMAKHYARNVFDRELHDGLLQEVLEAPPEHPGFTLVNTLAQSEAARLLAESDEFF